MRSFKFVFLLFLVGCSSSKVMTDYDDKTNFTQYKTYGFFEDVGEDLNEFDVKRVISTINSEIKRLGFSTNENPDFYINVVSKISENHNRNTIGIGVGGGGRNSGFGISGGIPIGGKKLNEEFIIEFVDAKTDELFWQGTLNSKIKEKRKPEDKELHFKEIINKILSNYPPRK